MSKILLHSPRTTFLQFSKIIFYGATKYLLLGRDISQHVLVRRMYQSTLLEPLKNRLENGP